MTTHQVQSRGIYHGLPVHPPSIKNLTAIITGANGISGHHMLRVLSQSPTRWTKIYCLSRRPAAIPSSLPANASHMACDFLSAPTAIAAVLQQNNIVSADHIFFHSYVQVAPAPGNPGLWTAAAELSRVNTALLTNFLAALSLAHIAPTRFHLQTGAKNYGVHLGPTAVPQVESAPRVPLEPNFYYAQEDALVAWCADSGRRSGAETQSVRWSVSMPACILGAVPDAAHNLCWPLAVYAAVCRRLGARLEFPGDLSAWETLQDQSSAMLNAYLAEWCVLVEGAAGERFNACDGSAFTWGALWGRLGEWFGVGWEGPREDGEGVYKEVVLPGKATPRGFGPPASFRIRFSFVDWAKKPEVQHAWNELATEHGLLNKQLTDIDRVFGFLDTPMAAGGALRIHMDKARKHGFHGTVSTTDCMLEVLTDFATLKMIPPFPGALPQDEEGGRVGGLS
ncbi:hypothetical protein K490DRAFT_39201 [Saccharata proteae CBS 121410]|uniref:PRISE-like Rossmann-fold domain-containing protein n=1 Tax=Saccharata proteae CBS 121410 TaxID=1314787 RepID=A0A9P4I0K1_9PEZI|nr:hypothetical protein K490DRAFT_39201 [Saccharata proteae CBS 121410]